MVELRDQYTGGHTRRVTQYSMMLAEKLELSEAEMELIRIGTPLHDIGKIGIEDAILRKPGRLTAKEFAEMQKHTTLGAHYLANIPELAPVIPIVRNHHERWDGTGYPDRLAGEEIPLLARIVAVCDAFDAITSDRPYHENKKGKPAEVAFAEIARQMGRQFDPVCAAAFLEIRDNILRVKCELMPGMDVVHAVAKPRTDTPAPAMPSPLSFDSLVMTGGSGMHDSANHESAVGDSMPDLETPSLRDS
jgi:putative nucleotidyltransferase with HDIG domain